VDAPDSVVVALHTSRISCKGASGVGERRRVFVHMGCETVSEHDSWIMAVAVLRPTKSALELKDAVWKTHPSMVYTWA
jgi:hypothetical protein